MKNLEWCLFSLSHGAKVYRFNSLQELFVFVAGILPKIELKE